MDTTKRTESEGTRTLELEPEDAATRKWWVSTLGLLSGAMQQWQDHYRRLVG